MRARVSLETPARPLSTFDTVETDTSASAATSASFALPCAESVDWLTRSGYLRPQRPTR